MRFCIYVITHQATGRCYVGKTDNPLRRLRQHLRISGYVSTHRHKKAVHHAIAAHGRGAFTFRVVAWFDDEDECLEAETRWIRKLHAVRPHGFNLNEGGRGGKSPSAESRAKVAAAKRGKPRSAATRARMSEASKGKRRTAKHADACRVRMTGTKLSEETRAKMRAAWERRRARGPSEREREAIAVFARVNDGRKHSAETRAKLADAHRGKTFSAETREKIRQARLNESPEVKARRAAAIATARKRTAQAEKE